VIQTSYTGGDLHFSPAMTLSEGGRDLSLPPRTSSDDYGCETGNCSDLLELSESVRRIVLHDEIPAAERFQIDRADVTGLTNALLGADGYFPPAVIRVLGTGARVYSKPGEAADLDCLDVAMIEARPGQRFLLAVSVPEDQGGCEALVMLATGVLRFLVA
jgi:hypothetical protein